VSDRPDPLRADLHRALADAEQRANRAAQGVLRYAAGGNRPTNDPPERI
jgi:hypothetical protein